MSEPLFSIVMPVYNVAPYLPACLDSLAALDPPPDEIVVVDDGSTDDCPRILAEFAPRLPQMRVIRQENGGLSAARNTGLNAARGKYLAFVDSDDFVEPDAYAEALRMAERDDLDMVLFNAEYHFEGRQPDRPIYADIPATDIVAGTEWMRQRLKHGRFLHMVWMHLYRREFIETNRLRFIPRLIHEDVIWTTEVLLAAKRIRYLPRVSVRYRIPERRPAPAQRQRQLEAIVASSSINARALAAMADGLADDPELQRLLSRQMVDGAFSIFHKIEKMSDRKTARTMHARIGDDGIFRLLWKHAQNNTQRRRIARQYLRSLVTGLFR